MRGCVCGSVRVSVVCVYLKATKDAFVSNIRKLFRVR